MSANRNAKTFAIIAGIAAIGAVVFLFDGGEQSGSIPTSDSSQVVNVLPEGSTNSENDTATSNLPQDKQALYVAIGNQIKDRFTDRLDSPYWRVKLINDLMIQFKKQYPNNWLEELEAFLRYAFPELAEDLISKLYALIEYNEWVESLKITMQFSSLEDRQAALWEKRLALFGEDAYEIWEAALKNEQLQAKIKQVNEHTGEFSEKASLYIDSLREVFGDDIVGDNAPHSTQMMTKFLELENVQSDLEGLPVEERYQKLREFRKELGMDEAALERWDALDQERIDAWDKADTYMQERAVLQQQYQGEEFDAKLTELQNELFGETEAEYIRKEERSGYYRFSQPQKYGLN